jgi:histidine ammonia-lyase
MNYRFLYGRRSGDLTNSIRPMTIPLLTTRAVMCYHGGNFHGDYVSLKEMDKLKIAISKLSMLLERQLNYLLN